MRPELVCAPKTRRTPLDVKGAAAYTGFEEGYLNKLRCKGGGPVYIKKSGIVRYDPDDLDAWLDAGKRRSTSEATEAA
ncbi:helix-turn-helix transcriptional regulator [Bradyrhizobium elkanii]|uniref:helix-turn-helix transcriptional regulator n=1 Tax=Bradyrhizobium elkanii TaxID=29448 RepID=UPI0021691B7F|nr:helix-turn-helix domain-containing protein [Bradyrhizobium elkanii]MCS3517080.1 hypothetical protein [Bradyrhizobium elkanii]MCS4073637.1 hypothetical protein [Bradyrhizobium elkanii]MCS4080270.1 hypothetical protein [Bradyrhizobium elkanii]MDH6691863.1 hypothetical protein [Bradyrhizobium elkanii]